MERDIRQKILDTISLFKEKKATSENKALTLKQLGLGRRDGFRLKMAFRSPFGDKLPFVEVDGKYYLDEERAANIDDLLMMIPKHPLQRWVKHTSRVPRGYLRYHVLQFLKEKPMSGSEITSQIEEHNRGRWKPGPGSLYPLLKKLKDGGFIESLPLDEGIKRYRLTDLGKDFVATDSEVASQMKERLGSGPFPFHPFMDLPPQLHSLRDTTCKAFEATAVIFEAICEDMDLAITSEFEKAMKSHARKLEKIVKRLETE